MKTKHWIAFLLLGLIWSSAFLWIKIAIAEIGPSTLVAYRVLLGLLFGAIFIVVSRRKSLGVLRDWLHLSILGLTYVAVPFFLIAWGEKSIDSGVASILNATIPLFTVFAAHFILHDDKMTWPKMIGLTTGFIGVIILMSKDVGSHSSSVFGQVAVIIACMFFAGSSIYARKYTQHTPGIVRGFAPLVSASIVMWVVAFTNESPIRIPSHMTIWIALIWLGVLCTGIAYLLTYYLIHEIGPSRTMMVTYLLPLGGVTLGVVFLNENLTWQTVLGGVIILASLFITNWRTMPGHS